MAFFLFRVQPVSGRAGQGAGLEMGRNSMVQS